MWNNFELKSTAKSHLRHFYWIGFALCALVLAVTLIAEGKEYAEYAEKAAELLPESMHFELPALITGVVATIAAYVVKIFLLFPLEVGEHRFFMERRSFKAPFKDAFFAFWNPTRYFGVVLIMLVYTLITTLGFLCFIIPGIFLSVKLFMVPFIAAANPEVSPFRAVAISWKATRGVWFKIFGFYLSFIGWYLLAIVTLGAAWPFVAPYFSASLDELYWALRDKAISENVTSAGELPEMSPAQ